VHLRHRAAAAILVCLLAGGARAQESTVTAPQGVMTDMEISQAVDRVRSDSNLGGTRTIRMLRWRQPDRSSSFAWPGWLSWIGDLVRFIAQSGRVLFWVSIVGLALALVAYLARVLSSRPSSDLLGRTLMPTHVRDLDIRPESLPADIGAAARRLWDRGDHRAALALLYRGLLSRLAHVYRVPIRDSTTEGDCLGLAVVHLDGSRYAYVGRLVKAWQRAVYGGSEPDDAAFHALCDSFGGTLDGSSSLKGPVHAAEASA
jgi:hypothetical protein